MKGIPVFDIQRQITLFKMSWDIGISVHPYPDIPDSFCVAYVCCLCHLGSAVVEGHANDLA